MPAPDLSGLWRFRKGLSYLNHGSFGACPSAIQDHREELLREIELDPMDFLLKSYQPLLESVLQRLEKFTGAEPGSLVMVENATTGINTILRNLPLKEGDIVMVTDREYFSSANALRVLASEKRLRLVEVRLPWPATENGVMEAFESAIVPGTRYALVDHIVSSTGTVMPLKGIIDLLGSRGIETVVDGAHGPGQVPLDLSSLGCIAYTGNCHKWLCSPRSAALLYVRSDLRKGFRPLVISHLPEESDHSISDYRLYFAWNGTPDPTPLLSIPRTLDYMADLLPGGWSAIMERNRRLALKARELLMTIPGLEPSCTGAMVGSMASVRIPGAVPSSDLNVAWTDPLQTTLMERHGIQVPVTVIDKGYTRLLRISAQLYNTADQYERLAFALKQELVS